MTICEFCSWLPRLWTSAMRKSMSSLSSLDIYLHPFIPGGLFSEFSSVRTYSNVKCKESTYSNFAQNVRWLIGACIEDNTVSLRCKFYHCSCSDKMMGSFANIYTKDIFVFVINLRSNLIVYVQILYESHVQLPMLAAYNASSHASVRFYTFPAHWFNTN